ncbi:hypothetical protein [Nonomuraea longicatena]|uniref:Uncharacterized protein n=1 Tax=Nonomuraea longicatena TaxID=83682 RepID=A0ABP4BFF0_9ACTN
MLERAPALRDGGGAVILWDNGAAVLRDLGIDAEEIGYRLDGTGWRGSTSEGPPTGSGPRPSALCAAP